ncbi:ester cyclase [Streptomyces virginiae]
MTFAQVIDYETRRFDEMNALIDRWAEQSSGRRTATHTMIGQDREARNHYVDMVEFASYEEAMKNSQLPETDRMFQEMVALCEGMPKFMNLDVVRDEHLNKQLAQRVFEEAAMSGNMGVLDECFATNYIDHDVSKTESTVIGREAMRSDMETWRAAFGMTFEPLAQLAEGDMVTTVWNWRGTHKGPFMGVAPTGKTYEMSGSTTFRCLDGEIVEGWWHYNPGALQQQMGGSGRPYGA